MNGIGAVGNGRAVEVAVVAAGFIPGMVVPGGRAIMHGFVALGITPAGHGAIGGGIVPVGRVVVVVGRVPGNVVAGVVLVGRGAVDIVSILHILAAGVWPVLQTGVASPHACGVTIGLPGN